MVKKGTFSLTLGEMDHFSVPHAAGYMLHNGVKKILQMHLDIDLRFSKDFLNNHEFYFQTQTHLVMGREPQNSEDFRQAREPPLPPC